MVINETLPVNPSDGFLAGRKLASPPEGEEIVISGIAGKYPGSNTVDEFKQNLFAKADLVNNIDRRWDLEDPEIPKFSGTIPNATKADAAFFGLQHAEAHAMDPACRMLLEKTFECVVDAGVNPCDLRGSNTGVFIASCLGESESTVYQEPRPRCGFGVTATCRTSIATRISYHFGTIGPAFVVDSACSSSMYALDIAYKSLRDGQCEAALVGTGHLCVHPIITKMFFRLGVLSRDGRCRCFDEKASGYVRSEAVIMMYLQKSKDAKRIYATLMHSKTNCDGYKAEGITYPASKLQNRLMSDVYQESGVDPLLLAYMEAHTTGTQVGDPEELSAIDRLFGSERLSPLLIGSVKSNIGHTEPASGLSSITKVIIAMETGFIPPNMHFSEPRQCIDALMKGRLQVVTEPMAWTPGYVGVNSFGFGGANCHALLKPNPKLKVNGGSPPDKLPRLVAVSGRTMQGVGVILDELEKQTPLNTEFVALLHSVFAKPIPGHKYRGYIILSHDGESLRDVQEYDETQRPVWFVFPGIGFHWQKTAQQLLEIPTFAASIHSCQEVLRPLGVDIKQNITSVDHNVLNLFTGIVATQIGMVDLLTELGITADGTVGHSIGEIGCAYADGRLDKKQALLTAYWLGVTCAETGPAKEAMALVGLSQQQCRKIVANTVDVTHHGTAQCVISGPVKETHTAMAKLQASGVRVQEIDCGGVVCDGRYSNTLRPKILKALSKVLPEPNDGHDPCVWQNTHPLPSTKALYFTKCVFSAANFDEVASNIPNKTALIAFGDSLLTREALGQLVQKKKMVHVEMASSVEDLLRDLGKLFELGLSPQLHNLYPTVQFPVSRGTPMISPLIQWNHMHDWFLLKYESAEVVDCGEVHVTIDVQEEEHKFLLGHIIDGRVLYPATGYLYLAWHVLSTMAGKSLEDLSVVFENIRFIRATYLPKNGKVMFNVTVQRASGMFEIVESGTTIVTGKISRAEDPAREMAQFPEEEEKEDKFEMRMKDIYKEMRLRGYNHSELFRGVLLIKNDGRYGKVQWVNNWIAYLDQLLQIQVLQQDTRGLFVPTTIDKLVIDVERHYRILAELKSSGGPEVTEVPVHICREARVVQGGGVEIRGLHVSGINRRKPTADPVLETYQFVPHFDVITPPPSLQTVLRICLHLVLENTPALKVRVAEVVGTPVTQEDAVLSPQVALLLGDLPLVQPEITLYTSPGPHTENLANSITVEETALGGNETYLLVIVSDVSFQPELLQAATKSLVVGGFMLTRENISSEDIDIPGLKMSLVQVVGDGKFSLFRKVVKQKATAVVRVQGEDFSWLPDLKAALGNEEYDRVLVVAEKEPLNGVIGLVNCIRKEPGGQRARCVFIMDVDAPPFDPEHLMYKTQLARDLAINVYRGGRWGSYRHLALEKCPPVLVPHAYVNNITRGDLSSLKWIEGPLNGSDTVARDGLVQVYYSALNFRDVMSASGRLAAEVSALGRIHQDCTVGMEFAGRDSTGKRVMGLVHSRALSNMVVPDPEFSWEIPDDWTLEDAATVPLVYGTAYYALIMKGQMRRGESILIHAGSGGVGQAAINLALHRGLVIYTTVGTEEKRNFIKQQFPQITDDYIFSSRDTSFEQRIMEKTSGRGVDLVLNSLAEDKLQASLRCVARGGRFMEIGKFDLVSNNPLGMEIFLREISYQGLMLDMLYAPGCVMKKRLHGMLANEIKEGGVRPLSRTVFEKSAVEDAFRYMAAGKHIGKVLIQIREEEANLRSCPTTMLVSAVPRFFCSPHRSYVIIGGLGGFGLELADWLVLRGAMKLVLSSRRGVFTGYQRSRIRTWESYGIKVMVSTVDVTTREGIEVLLKSAISMGPVDAIFNLAVVLEDALMENQTEQKFATSAAPKAVTTRLLDAASRRLCPDLRHFVVFSSVSCGRGNAGQTNYGMSNSVMERLCERRCAEGLPALAVQWGAVGQVGLVAEMQEENHEIVIGGTLQQTIASCLSVLDDFLRQSHPVVASMVVAEKRAAAGAGDTMVACVANIVGIRDMKTVNMHASLAELGMDSMMGVEIRQTLEREFDILLSAQEIRNLTLARLQEIQTSTTDGTKEENVREKVPSEEAIDFGLLFRIIGQEEASTELLVPLPSLGDGPTVVMVPGIEGVAAVMHPLSNHLSARVHCLQLPRNMEGVSLTDMAAILLPHLKSVTGTEPFKLVGYSFGGLVALELAMACEREGMRGRLLLIDSSPTTLQRMSRQFISDNDEDDTQLTIISFMLGSVAKGEWGNIADVVLGKLKDLDTLEKRLDYALSVMPHVKYGKSYSIEMIKCFYHRLRATAEYSWGHGSKLQSPVLLVRPSTPLVQAEEKDYGLSKVCHSVEVSVVEGSHVTVLENKQTSDHITSFLEFSATRQ